MKKLISFSLGLLSLGSVWAQEPPLYLNQDAPVAQRVEDLLARMTVEEKIALLHTTSPAIPRLGIGRYNHGNEALHGVVRPGKFTVFPQAIALASSWNPELHFRIATAISDEARARWNELEHGAKIDEQYSDLLTFFSPTINMARDPRWGRTPETYGEDPFLAGTLGVQFIRGLQGDHPRYLKTVSIAKHFAANNEEHNRFECDAVISQRGLREYYLPAFEMAVTQGGVAGIMSAYNAINGVPCSANPWLLNKVLRDDWGFKGYVISDCGAPDMLVTHHKYVDTYQQAAAVAIKSGLDAECMDHVFIEPLHNAYKQGMVSLSDIDRAASRMLYARMRLGLFDNPNDNPYNKLPPSLIGSKEHQALARESAREGIVLLKNDMRTLPIDLAKIKKIAVVGINADKCEFGDYSGEPINEPVTILEGIRRRAGSRTEVVHAPWISVGNNEMVPEAAFAGPVKAEYYDNRDLAGEPKVRYEKWINFDPSNQPPDPFVPKSPVSIRWTGALKPDLSGKYRIGFMSDDGCRLFIDGRKVFDRWVDRPPTADYFEMELEAGKSYDFVAEYYDSGTSALARMVWQRPDTTPADKLALFGEAGRIARDADLTIAVMGIDKSIEREGQDRDDIRLPHNQQEFLEALYEVNPNLVVVLVAGSSLAVEWLDDNVPAIVNAWYPGEQGGTAVAEVLFGDYNPAGRLPLTYYRSLNDLPAFGEYEITDNRTYQYFQGIPLYPFGHGLSYTSFKYDKLRILDKQDVVEVNFEVRNTGRTDGDEVAQLYVQMPETGVTMPLQQLKGFKRVHIVRGRTRSVTIAVDRSDLRYWDDKSDGFVCPAGTYRFMVGASSADIRLRGEITLEGKARVGQCN